MNNIRKHRTNAKLTIKELAKIANISYIALFRYEHSIQTPSVEIAMKLAKVLNTTVEELYET